MIKIEKTEVIGWEAAIRGMRNPLNSWDKCDSNFSCEDCAGCFYEAEVNVQDNAHDVTLWCNRCALRIGKNDIDLMMRLRNAGTDHRKFMRMITVYVDLTAPLYWWKEFDTYKVGTVANSCSTMHKIHAKEFELDDFSHEHLLGIFDGGAAFDYNCPVRNESNKNEFANGGCVLGSMELLKLTIDVLNTYRYRFIKTKNKEHWWQMIQLLPSSYNQKRTVMLNYEVLANMYKSRKAHKLDEWLDFCKWVEGLPYSELITG